MANEDLFHGVAFACDSQASFGAVDPTIRDLGNGDESDGYVLGIRDAGDAESGITMPTFTRVGVENMLLGNATRQPTSFLRTAAEGLSISVAMQNLDTASGAPDAGVCLPPLGHHGLWESCALDGANGANPTYEYTPTADIADKYLTIKLFAGDHSWVFQDCLCDCTIVLTPGGIGVATFNVKVGSIQGKNDSVTFPTVDYTNFTDVSVPLVQAPATDDTHEWPDGTAKPFNTYSLTINPGIEEVPDSNAPTGIRPIVTSRVIDLTQRTWVDINNPEFEYDELIASGVQSALATQVGDIAGAAAPTNAYKIHLLETEIRSIKYDRIGTLMAVDSVVEARSDADAGDFQLIFN